MKKTLPIYGGLLGLGLAIAEAHSRKSMGQSEIIFPSPNPADWRGWVWPLAIRDGREPVISDRYQKIATEEHRQHMGVDLTYRRKIDDPAGLPTSTRAFHTPKNTPAVAAFEGKIWSAGMTPRGLQVTIDHGKQPQGGLVTWYQHLASFAKPWKKGDRIHAGQVLGIVGGDILPGAYPFHHLHFELWFPRKGIHPHDWAANPAPYMRYWRKVEL